MVLTREKFKVWTEAKTVVDQAKLRVVQDANATIEAYFDDPEQTRFDWNDKDEGLARNIKAVGRIGFSEKYYDAAAQFVYYWLTYGEGTESDDLDAVDVAEENLKNVEREVDVSIETFEKLATQFEISEYTVDPWSTDIYVSLPGDEFEKFNMLYKEYVDGNDIDDGYFKVKCTSDRLVEAV